MFQYSVHAVHFSENSLKTKLQKRDRSNIIDNDAEISDVRETTWLFIDKVRAGGTNPAPKASVGPVVLIDINSS